MCFMIIKYSSKRVKKYAFYVRQTQYTVRNKNKIIALEIFYTHSLMSQLYTSLFTTNLHLAVYYFYCNNLLSTDKIFWDNKQLFKVNNTFYSLLQVILLNTFRKYTFMC